MENTRSLGRTSFTLLMLMAAALSALVLGAVGLYGVLSYVAAGLIGVAALASYVPARRASAVDPAESLAAE